MGAGKEPYTIHHSHVPVDGLTPSGFMISCRPEYQCKMYARLNLLLSSLANRFLMEEFRAKRITETMAASFVEKWVELGRAQFTEFWCGLPFQARILFDCRDHCMFFGEYDRTRRDNILGYLKINANSMALATYCHGDSAIQKHFVDCWKVLDLLGATFAEYESMSRLHVGFHDTVKAEKKKNDKNGVEHYWDPAPVPVTPIIPRARTPML